jgi:uncharacterized protein (TIGR02246 family)
MKFVRSIAIPAGLLCALAVAVWAGHSGALSASAAPAPSRVEQTTPKDAADFSNLRVQWMQAMRAKNADKVVALYAPDAVFLSSQAGRVAGKPAILELCKTVMGGFTSDLTFHSLVTDRSGDLAYDSGEYTESLLRDADGVMTQARGNYLMVYKHSAAGWLIVEQDWIDAPADAKR